MLYWRYVPYLGLGAAACTFTGQALVTNSCDIAKYNEGKNRQIENLTQPELAAESLFMGLRTAQGVNLQETKERFGCDTWSRYGRELDQAIHAGLLSYDAASQILRLTAKGMQITDPADGEKEWIAKATTTVWPKFYASIGGKDKLDKVLNI